MFHPAFPIKWTLCSRKDLAGKNFFAQIVLIFRVIVAELLPQNLSFEGAKVASAALAAAAAHVSVAKPVRM